MTTYRRVQGKNALVSVQLVNMVCSLEHKASSLLWFIVTILSHMVFDAFSIGVDFIVQRNVHFDHNQVCQKRLQWKTVDLIQSWSFAPRTVGQWFDQDRTASTPSRCFLASKRLDEYYCTILCEQRAHLRRCFGLLEAFFRIMCHLYQTGIVLTHAIVFRPYFISITFHRRGTS